MYLFVGVFLLLLLVSGLVCVCGGGEGVVVFCGVFGGVVGFVFWFRFF